MASTGPKYTEEQRAAIETAVNELGRPAKDVQAAAKAGELATGLEPFDIPVGTIRDIANEAQRRTNTAAPSLSEEEVELLEDMRGVLKGEAKLLRNKQSDGRTAAREASDLARAMRDYLKLKREIGAQSQSGGEPTPNGNAEPSQTPGEPSARSLLDEIEGRDGPSADTHEADDEDSDETGS